MRRIRISVKPGARDEAVVPLEDGSYRVRVKAAPVDGKANAAVIAALAAHFGLRRAQLRIRTGAGSRDKWVEIDD